MKIAVTGKGGVGKTTFAGILAHLAHADGKTVLAVDSDPDANLANALGMPFEDYKAVIPISRQKDLIEERTGARLKQFGQIFKLNPDVADVADRFSTEFRGIHLLVLGAVDSGGSGCACPENVFLRNLLSHIILKRDEFVIVDMEAGIEHLGRGTARGVDLMVVITEPTLRSVLTAQTIDNLAGQIGLQRIRFVGNKINGPAERAFLTEKLGADRFLGFIPAFAAIGEADRREAAAFDILQKNDIDHFLSIYKVLTSEGHY
jgi:CO dehydrogenase maturation factor